MSQDFEDDSGFYSLKISPLAPFPVREISNIARADPEKSYFGICSIYKYQKIPKVKKVKSFDLPLKCNSFVANVKKPLI